MAEDKHTPPELPATVQRKMEQVSAHKQTLAVPRREIMSSEDTHTLDHKSILTPSEAVEFLQKSETKLIEIEINSRVFTVLCSQAETNDTFRTIIAGTLQGPDSGIAVIVVDGDLQSYSIYPDGEPVIIWKNQ